MKYTKEQIEFIRRNALGRGNEELKDMFNRKFGTSLTRKQIKACKQYRKISSGLTGQFEKGSVPFNKGKKFPGRINSGCFKKGQSAINYLPVGSERIDSNNYILIKVQDTGGQWDRWAFKHRVIWEKTNGQIPKGHAVVFLDGNKQNTELSNLALVSHAERLIMNQEGLFFGDAEITKNGVAIAKLTNTAYRKMRK